MPFRYDIAPHPQGWAVLEDGVPVEVRPDRDHAAEIAQLLASASQAFSPPEPPPRPPA